MMNSYLLLLTILLPLFTIIFLYVFPKKISGFIVFIITLIDCFLAGIVYNKNFAFKVDWAGFGADFILKTYHFNSFMILAAGIFSSLIALYSLGFLKNVNTSRNFYLNFLLTLSFVNGAFLSDNLILFLFFWEGLLVTLFGFIIIGGKASFHTAIKAFVIVGISDLCLMGGIAIAGHLAGTMEISQINLPLNFLGSVAFVLMVIGAMAKAGSMPFHTWIPDAAIDAPLPFMAFIPGALEKLLGIYLLIRITLDMFQLTQDSIFSVILMIVGSITIIFAVMMALIQKNFKKLLSYHAVSQVGYMILGIGTCVPAGIVGGIFHMLNNAIYKSCLFLTGGALEKQSGTTDLEKLGGLFSKMPITFACFFISALSISGVPPFNGFFSKELIYDGALERGFIFYFFAMAGSFFTAISFLKLGHSAFFGKRYPDNENVKEVPFSMLVPMILLSFVCILFGVFNSLPINKIITPVLQQKVHGHEFSGPNFTLIIMTLIILTGAVIHHFAGAKINGSALKAADNIHYAPGLFKIYEFAEKSFFDPYVLCKLFLKRFFMILWKIDRIIDNFYNFYLVQITNVISWKIRKIHSGYYVVYVIWSLLGACAIIFFIFKN